MQTFIGEPLRNGITVGGRHFEFLLCSNSSLREHAVWFLEPFDSNTGESIRASIGCFTEPKPELVYQPAKLLARMGQALSATDPTVTLEPHEVEEDVEDIERNDSVFTDGLGDISQQLADEVWYALWHALNPNSPRESLPRTPVAFQVTFPQSIKLWDSTVYEAVDTYSRGQRRCRNKPHPERAFNQATQQHDQVQEVST